MGIYNAMFRSEQEADAFYEAYLQPHQVSVYRVILRYVRNHETAEDLMQETMYSALKNAHQLKDPTKSHHWLLTIARNQALFYLRKNKVVPQMVWLETCPEDLMEALPSALDEVLRHHNTDALREAIESLDPDTHTIMWLHLEEDCTFQQIAEILKLSPKTVSSKFYRGRKKIAAYLQKLDQLE